MSEMQKYTHFAGAYTFVRREDGAQAKHGDVFYLASDVDARLALMQRAVDWLIGCGAFIPTGDAALYFEKYGVLYSPQPPADLADIIRGSK